MQSHAPDRSVPHEDDDASAEAPHPADTEGSSQPRRSRRLTDHLLRCFHLACDESDHEVARRLLAILEVAVVKEVRLSGGERRKGIASLVAAHERLWLLRNGNAPEQLAGD